MIFDYIRALSDFVFVEDEPKPADIIFVPGSASKEHAVYAAKLWKAGFAPLIMPSGRYSVKRGYFPGEHETEWDFLRDVLINEGVSSEAILLENHATNTYENAIYSREQTVKLGMVIQRAIICCKADHSRRCLMYYETLFPETEFYVCSVATKGITKDNWYQSSEGIDRVMGELSRCGHQFVDILKEQLKH
jgi:uncharacterized SAM-binding protein YcdF (DUF218 family)